MKRFINFINIIVFFIIGFVTLTSAQEEKITITTYYPSPYGSYAELRADRMAVGSGYRTSTIPTDGLIVQGNVGIGTTTPTSPAPNGRRGNLDVNDVYLRSMNGWASQLRAQSGTYELTRPHPNMDTWYEEYIPFTSPFPEGTRPAVIVSVADIQFRDPCKNNNDNRYWLEVTHATNRGFTVGFQWHTSCEVREIYLRRVNWMAAI